MTTTNLTSLALPAGLAVTVLGSGGPFSNRDRVSSGYLISLNGRPRLLVDAGGGVFQRVGQAGIDLTELDAVLLTHLHIDHSGGLAPIVFSAYMNERTRPITVAGPAPNDTQPGCREFCDLLFGASGAWRYLHTFDGFGIDAIESPSDPADSHVHPVLDSDGLRVRAAAAPHGMMPAVSYRIDAGDQSVVVSGDVSRFHAPLAELAHDAGILIHDMALPERPGPHSHLHAPPSQVGRLARASQCRLLVLSHVMPDLEDERPPAEALIRQAYPGPLIWATDLMTIPVPATPIPASDQSRPYDL